MSVQSKIKISLTSIFFAIMIFISAEAAHANTSSAFYLNKIKDQAVDLTSDAKEFISNTEKTMPSEFKIFIRSIKERFFIFVTRNPEQKIQRRLEYARDNLELADLLNQQLENDDYKRIEKALKRANNYMGDIDMNSVAWIPKIDQENMDDIASKLSGYQIKSEDILDKVEFQFSGENLDKFQELREDLLGTAKTIIGKLNLESFSGDTKQKIVEVKNQIQTREKDLEEYQAKREALLYEAKESGKDTRIKLEKLYKERRGTLGKYLQRAKEGGKEIKKSIKEAAQEDTS